MWVARVWYRKRKLKRRVSTLPTLINWLRLTWNMQQSLVAIDFIAKYYRSLRSEWLERTWTSSHLLSQEIRLAQGQRGIRRDRVFSLLGGGPKTNFKPSFGLKQNENQPLKTIRASEEMPPPSRSNYPCSNNAPLTSLTKSVQARAHNLRSGYKLSTTMAQRSQTKHTVSVVSTDPRLSFEQMHGVGILRLQCCI